MPETTETDNIDICLVCQKPIPPGPDCCSPECEEKLRIEHEIAALEHDQSK